MQEIRHVQKAYLGAYGSHQDADQSVVSARDAKFHQPGAVQFEEGLSGQGSNSVFDLQSQDIRNQMATTYIDNFNVMPKT